MHTIQAKSILSSKNGIKERYIQTYGNAYELPVQNQAQLLEILREECRKHHIVYDADTLFQYMATFEDKQAGEQLTLF